MAEGIGIFADSRGDLEAIEAAYHLLVARGASRFFFAGGRYADLDRWIARKRRSARQPADAQELLGLENKFVRVRERDGHGATGTKALDMLGDVLCCIVHDKDDLSREDLLNASLFFHGGGSEPAVVQIGPRSFVTPGQLSGVAQQTCGLIEAVDGKLRFCAFSLSGQSWGDGWWLSTPKQSKISVR